MKQRVVFRIQLTLDAKQSLERLTDELGITQIAATSKLVEWFAGQPDTVQGVILGLFPDMIKQDVAELILRRMASDQRDELTAAAAGK